MKVIDATNLILGRFCAKIAKAAINGEEIAIVNCENAVVVGDKYEIFARYKHNCDRGATVKGPYIHRKPDRLVRRTLRGMIPYKTKDGKAAFQRVMCYIGVPKEFESVKAETMSEYDINNTRNVKFATMGEISKHLGGI
jgi:large subunit ribosomal protein L13